MGPNELVQLLPSKQWDISTREARRRRKVKRAEQASFLRAAAVRIIEAVAQLYGVGLAEMLEHTRVVAIAEARAIACYLVRARTGLSYPVIGELLGRHHTTVMHACRAVSGKLSRWPGGSTALAISQAEQACEDAA
jgi:chromosomal replication initiation ATPase DnaA